MSDETTDSSSSSSGGGSGPNGKRPPPKPPKPHAVVVPLPDKRELAELHRVQLTESGLTPETCELAQLYSEHHAVKIAALLQRRSWPGSQGGALVFPFFFPGASTPHAYRIKPTNPRTVRNPKTGKEKPVKYDQSPYAGVLIYFAPRARAADAYQAADAANAANGAPLYWTEGEKKTLALDQLGLTCVGLTGVWNWTDPARSKRDRALHPDLMKHVRIAGRAHVLCFDADSRNAEHSDKIMLAAGTLCGFLLRAGAISVRFVCPPDIATAKGIDDFYALHGAAAAHALLATATELEPIAPEQPLPRLRSLAALRDAPLADDLLLPEGFDVQKDGSLWSGRDDKHGDTKVTHTPMYLTRKLRDHATHDERVELAYMRGERWVTSIVSRKAVADSRTLVAEAAPVGAPVTSGNAAKIVDWLDALDHANPQLPTIACVSTGGWHRIDGVRFFAAREPIAPEAAKLDVVIDDRGDRRKMLAALTPRGKLDAHVAALQRAWAADPICAAAICAAFAATLLEPLRAGNFAVHLAGESSRGKTSMLKIAASVFGDPASPQWVASWNVTATGAELRATVLCDLPQCYDEVGGGDPQATERLVYALINGGGRTRAQRDLSMRETTSWRTVVLSTGERELADDTTATGAQVRVVQFAVRGFGALTGAQIDALRDDCAVNAGCAGDEWLRRIVETDDWVPAQDVLTAATKRMRAIAAADPLQGRVAAYFALLAVTESMLADAFGLGDRNGATMFELLENTSERERVTSLAERARELVENWVMSEPDAFPDLEVNSAGEGEPRSRTGRTRHGFRRSDGTLLVIPAEFRAFCARNRLSHRVVIREWLRLGWTQVDPGRADKQVRLGLYGRNRFVFLAPTDDLTVDSQSADAISSDSATKLVTR